jgi:hypothetical protein
MTDVNLINADVLTVAPDERLIIHILQDDLSDQFVDDLMKELQHIGIEERTLVLFGIDATFAKTKTEP